LDDALFTNSESRISEGTTWNIRFVDGHRIVWPESDVLPGVTMHLVKSIVAKIGMASTAVPLALSDVSEMTSAFVTNVSVGVRPVRSIDDTPFSDDAPVLGLLRQSYMALPGEPL